MTWPIIFMLVVLKIPVLYLGAVVWWAIKAEPRHEEPSSLVPVLDLDPPGRGWRLSRSRRRPPRGPSRRPPSRTASARARARR